MSIFWLFFACLCLAFSTIPWIILYAKQSASSPMLLVFAAGWSALPLAIALYLTYFALCRIHLTCADRSISRRVTFLGLGRERRFAIDRATLVRQWHHSKHGDVPRDVLFIGSADSTHRLVDELMCKDLQELLKWIGNTANVRTIDARDREPIGI